jgi:hypothetical protein
LLAAHGCLLATCLVVFAAVTASTRTVVPITLLLFLLSTVFLAGAIVAAAEGSETVSGAVSGESCIARGSEHHEASTASIINERSERRAQ